MIAKPRIVGAWAAMALVAALSAAIWVSDPVRAAEPQGAPQARAPQGPPPTGTATLTIQVVAADTGAPVRGARLAVFGTPIPAPPRPQGAPGPPVGMATGVGPARDAGPAAPRVPLEGKTDQAGAAVFTALPAGLYVINVAPPAAFVRGQPPPSVRVNEGASAKAVVQLDRGGVITGRVFDEDGEAVTGARITVYRQTNAGGVTRGSSAGSSEATNDLGQFRVWGLPAGDYLVSALFSDYSMMAGEPGVREGMLPTFYPGVVAYDSARALAVKSGQETGGADFQLVHGRLGAVSGRATDSSGNPLSTAGGMSGSVSLSPRSQNPGFSGRGAALLSDGSFTIQGVPPGEYYLSAMKMRPDLPNSQREGAYVLVSVNGDEVTANIQTNLGATIAGRVVVEGIAPAGQPGAPGSESQPTPVTVTLLPSTLGGSSAMAFSNSASAMARPDGTFGLAGVRGPVQVGAQVGRAAIKSVTRGGRDISGQPLELLGTERIEDITIVMTYDTGGIDGAVADPNGEAVAGATVVVFPDDPARWAVGSPFVRQSRSAAASAAATGQAVPGGAASAPLDPGAFSVTMLPAGRYALVAFPAGTTVLRPDRESLERWRASATVVTVNAGQTSAVKLTPIK